MTKDIRVEIYGQTYTLSGQLDPAYVEQLARTVDDKMRTLQRQTDTLDTRRLAVLAALNLADELRQMKERTDSEREGLPREFAARVAECARQLDTALKGEPAR